MTSGIAPRGSHRTVLFVDDDEDTLFAYAAAIGDEEHSVEIARCGAEGLALARIVRPDVIFLDVRLPDMDGRDVLRKLKAAPGTSSIPVILLTALPRGPIVSETAQAHPFAVLSKPCTVEDLLGLIADATSSKVMRRAQVASS